MGQFSVEIYALPGSLLSGNQQAGSSSAWFPKAGGPTVKTPPRTLFSQRALMSRADGLPIAYVVEDYQRGLLGFTPG